MTEKEYIVLSNRVNISRARDILREVMPGKKYGISITDFKKIRKKLGEIETDLFHKMETMEDAILVAG